ncbi:MAG: Eco57I restriction-modification methylase domain-containing protein [Candidatus Nanohalobium sp.]
MPLDTIEKSDILDWNSKEDIADTLEKRGLNRLENVGSDDEIVMELDEEKFLAIVTASGEETASDYNSRMTSTRQTQVVSTDDFEQFTFTTRRRAWDKHGQIKYNRWQIEKEQFRPGGEANTALEKLNNIEHGDSQSINQLYETKKVVNEFYEKFESIRADMVHKVSGIPEDEGEKKQNYAQTIFDRLIFLHFIQEKKLLDYNQDYLEENHDEIIENGGDVYEEFYKPLFFKWLATDQEHPDDTLPYLNGGLFTETDVEREYEDVRLGEDTEETNKLFTEILDFLGDWNWHADERLDIVDPNRLSPELLGHIFEKTVNQKEMGAYYTPEEITHFMSRNTIQPYILDRINEEFDKDYEEIDELFKIPDEVEEEDENSVIIGDIDEIEREEIEHLYFEVLQDLKVLDPAVGSGAFLLAAQEVLIDIYMSALQYFQKLDEKASWEMTEKIQDLVTELENNAAKTSAEKSMHAKRQIILNNLYGVDIDKGATEICKLRLWLSIVADLEKGDDPHKVETLPNIDFNIRQGNSLIGFTEPIEKALNDDIEDEKSQANLNQYSPDAIHKKYNDIIQKIKTYKKHEKEGNGEKAEKARQEAFQLLEKYREDPDEKILQQFHEAGIEDVDMEDIKEFSPFHWVLEFAEVYSEGGFDVIIGNPPWEEVKLTRGEFFSKYDPAFRQRDKDEKDQKEEELLEDSEIVEEYEKKKEEKTNLADYFTSSGNYNLQTSVVDGKTLSGNTDLAPLFAERIFDITKETGYVSLLLPKTKIFTAGSKKSLRKELLDSTSISHVLNFENRGIFDDLHQQKKFGIITYHMQGSTDKVLTSYEKGKTDVLRNMDNLAVEAPRLVLEEYSPETVSFPAIRSKLHMETIESLIRNPQLGKEKSDSWNLVPYRELDKNKARDRFFNDRDRGDYPVVGGTTIHQYSYRKPHAEEPNLWSLDEDKDSETSAKARIREKNYDNLKSKLVRQLGWENSSKSQISFLNSKLEKKRGKEYSSEDVLLDSTAYRPVFRKVTQTTNERTMISAILPPGVATVDPITTIRPYKIDANEDELDEFPLRSIYKRRFTDRELFVVTGILNSICFDYLLRPKVEANISNYKVLETQAPRINGQKEWFKYISERSAKLNCYRDEFKEIRERLDIEAVEDEEERAKLRAEIDAAVIHAYGLDREEAKFLINDFDTIENPDLMTEDYFDMVLEKFDELDEEGPLE